VLITEWSGDTNRYSFFAGHGRVKQQLVIITDVQLYTSITHEIAEATPSPIKGVLTGG